MAEDKNKNLEDDKPTPLQSGIEDRVAMDEETLEGEELSIALSRDRTHMSEHRTKMSEHRTGLSEHRTELSEHRTELSDKRTDLSLQRTALSYERTLMSWIRTAVALISFGFTIYKAFEEFQKATPAQTKIFTPRLVGLIMIAFGFIGLLFAEIQHIRAYKKLKQDYPEIQQSLSSILAALILVFGLILFLATLFRQ